MKSISNHDALYDKRINRDVISELTGENIAMKFSLVEWAERELGIKQDKYSNDRVIICRAVVNSKIEELETELFKLKNLRSMLGMVNIVDNQEQ